MQTAKKSVRWFGPWLTLLWRQETSRVQVSPSRQMSPSSPAESVTRSLVLQQLQRFCAGIAGTMGSSIILTTQM